MCLGTNRRALSLFELLTALSVVALAIGVIVPSLNHHRGNSLLTSEQSNLRIIAQLMAKYGTDDPDGILGPVHPRANEFSYGTGHADYGGGPGHSSYFYGWNQQFDPRTRPFNLYLYGRDRIAPTTGAGEKSVFKPFQCTGQDFGWQFHPSGGIDDITVEKPYFAATGTSFRMNTLPAINGTSGMYGRPASRIPAPSLTLGFMETRAYQTIYTNEISGYDPPFELRGCHEKLGFFSVIYCDGRTNFVDFGFGTYFAPTYQIDVRGTWGRMDCLPDTPLNFNQPRPSNTKGASDLEKPILAEPTK